MEAVRHDNGPVHGARPTAHAALYVATDFRSWSTDEPEPYEPDVISDGVTYRRLDLAYYAWLRHRADAAMQARNTGKITDAAFDVVCTRFSVIYDWMVVTFGIEAMERAEREADVRGYMPPRRRG